MVSSCGKFGQKHTRKRVNQKVSGSEWVKTWGGQGTEDATGTVIVDKSNNVYIAGRFASVACDFNPGGTPDIHSTHNPAPPGSTWQRQYEAWDAFISKYASDGTFQWAKTWGGNGQDNATGLAADGAGQVYVSGWFSGTVDFDPGDGVDNHTSNGHFDAFLGQFDSGGSFQWAKTWGGSGLDSSGVTLDAVGNVYAAGTFMSTVDFDPSGGVDNHAAVGAKDAFITKFLIPSVVPVLLAPTDGVVTTTQAITLSWQAGAGNAPAGYNVDLDGQVITTSNTTSSTVLANGVHTWTVRADNAAGYSAWVTPAWAFEITDTLPAPHSPILMSPSNGSLTMTQAITFSWRADTGAAPTGYNVQIDGDVITSTGTSSATVLSMGVHTWTVRAYNGVGYSGWAAPWTVEARRYDIYLPLVTRNP